MTKYSSQRESNKDFPYGHVFHTMGDNGYIYKRSDFKTWNIPPLLIKHYYLTMRLDGYGYLTASDAEKQNCLTFREELESRNVDAIGHVMWMEEWYNWGHREIVTHWYPLDDRYLPNDMATRYVRIGL